MRYGQDYDSLWRTLLLFASYLAVVLVTFGILRRLEDLDKESEKTKLWKNRVSMTSQLCICFLSGEMVWECRKIWDACAVSHSLLYGMLLAIGVGCLSVASMMDVEGGMIYDYVWWLGMVVGALMICMGNGERISEWILFVLLQEILFSKFYGRADCHAFGVCAMLETSMGMGMKAFLMHMLGALVLLAVVQGVRGNISKSGTLKRPAPFLPYITLSFHLLLYIYANNIDFF